MMSLMMGLLANKFIKNFFKIVISERPYLECEIKDL